MDYDVSVIGLGRVGLPLALVLRRRRAARPRRGQGPRPAGRAARRAHAVRRARGRTSCSHGVGDRLAFSERAADAARRRVHRPDGRDADASRTSRSTWATSGPCWTTCCRCCRPGQLLVLRSTVAPGTTEFVAGYLEKHRGFVVGEDVFVAHVPERIAAAQFLEEIGTLPCIVGGVGARVGRAGGGAVRRRSARRSCRRRPSQAELAKIWANILRYTTFALPNLLMMDCERYDANVFDVIELINRDYPRGGIAAPGFTAGTCLRKDFAFSEERSSAPGMLLAVSRVNESVPVVPRRRRQAPGRAARCGSRRSRSWDWPSSATPTTSATRCRTSSIRLLERELADVVVHDPMVATPTSGLRRRR